MTSLGKKAGGLAAASVSSRRRPSSSASVISVVSSDSEDFAPSPPRSKKSRKAPLNKRKSEEAGSSDVTGALQRNHGTAYHDIEDIVHSQDELLQWFEGVREKRGMPWRKRYDAGLSMEEKGQRAYEIWGQLPVHVMGLRGGRADRQEQFLVKQVTTPPTAQAPLCELCEPILATADGACIPSVTIFPMKKLKKESRVEEEVVCVVESGNKWLFVKRPEKGEFRLPDPPWSKINTLPGLLAGLFEPPTTPLSDPSQVLSASLTTLSTILGLPLPLLEKLVVSHKSIGKIQHVFSHINMTYHISHLVLSPSETELELKLDTAVWLSDTQVEQANIGTGVKKVWAEVYGAWGCFDVAAAKGVVKKRKTKAADSLVKVHAEEGGKKKKTIMMPRMPGKVF
ncbi:hypothetical protein P7C73_g5390, partial [Tremellales sp. Uapishka_1]